MKSTLIALSLCLIAGCGGGDTPPPEPAEDGPAAGAILLHVQLLEASPELQATLRAWASERGFELDLDLGAALDAGAPEMPALIELDASDFAAWVNADHLRPFTSSGAEGSSALHLHGVGAFDGSTYGLPWRGELHALAVRSASIAGDVRRGWSDLARWCASQGGLALPSEAGAGLSAAYFQAFASRAALPAAESTGRTALEGEVPVEALGFLSRLARPAERGSGAARLASLSAGKVGASSFDGAFLIASRESATEETGALLAFPPAEVGGPRPAWIQPRLLAVPRRGAHRDVAEELALMLTSQATAGVLLADGTTAWLPLRKDHGVDESELDTWTQRALELRSRAIVPPLGWWAESLHVLAADAVDASLERRRSPANALVEARSRWDQEHADAP